MRIVAVPDRQVRDPVTRRIVDETGITVEPTDLYWARALTDGDVAEAEDLPEAPPAEDETRADEQEQKA